jgi:hypothetical protein
MKMLPITPWLLLFAFIVSPFSTVAAGTAATVQGSDIASKAPAVIFLMRHAEKPDGRESDLSPQGFRRAQVLPRLFVDGRLPKPDAIFATAPSKHSNRPIETVTPLAQALHLKVNADYEDIEAGPLAKQVLSGKYAGKVVVICWHHGEIPNVARSLGVTDAPAAWNSDIFDQIWKIVWVDGKAQMSIVPEHLFSTDSQ